MKSNTAIVLSYVGLSEGGYVNHPKDPGGATNKGITQKTYDSFNRLKGRPKKNVINITKTEAEEILVEQYFAPIKFDDLPAGLDYSVGDFSVNSGPRRAAIVLQECLGFTGDDVDGIVGINTLDAINETNIKDLIIRYNHARLAFVKRLDTWATFGKGWQSRIMGEHEGFQVSDIGVIDRSVKMYEGQTVIPAPIVVGVGKALDEDEKNTSLVNKVMSDPVAILPVIGTVLTPLADFNEWVQGALAFSIVAAVLFALVRAAKRK